MGLAGMVKVDEIELKKEVSLDIDYDREKDKYTLENDQLNIFAVDNNLDQAIESIEEQIGMLWKEFVKEDITNLTESAIDFRKMLLNMLGE